MPTLGFCGYLPFSRQTSIRLPSQTQPPFPQTSPDKSVTCPAATASFTLPLEPEVLLGYALLTQGSQPSMTFLFVGSSVCRWLPSDPSSRKRPCLKLGVIRHSAPRVSSIWTLVLLQGTFTPLVHAHAGRTQHSRAD